jgi:TPR repeat protein
MKVTLFLFHFLFILFSLLPVVSIKIETLDVNIGEEKGISEKSVISTDVLGKILKGVESGNPDNIYFYGLLKLYGISMTKDLVGAAQQFRRASSLGHKEATTAYGVLLLTGMAGKSDYIEAISSFRDGIARGDMVRRLF